MSKIKTSISLSPATHARVVEEAQREQRTISNMLERLIEKLFGNPARKKTATPEPSAK